MGRLSALAFSEQVEDGNISLTAALSWHLSGNHYPPVPQAFVPVCEQAIAAALDEDEDRLVTLPEGISWKDGRDAVEAWRLVESFHLDSFL